MLDLQTIIRTRVASQLALDQTITLANALKQSLWIYGDYGIASRIQSRIRSPLKRIPNALKIPIGRAYRVIDPQNAAMLFPGYSQPIQDHELLEKIPDEGIDREELAKQLNMTVRKLNYRIRKEQNNWTILKHDNTIYPMKTYLPSIPDDQLIILEILQKYQYCTIDQLELFTGKTRQQLSQPITELAAQDRIIRGLTRTEAPDEIFSLPTVKPIDKEVDIPVFVLERRDAMVEMIATERYFESKGRDYWIFIDGLPEAEFDLDKSGSIYSVKDLSRFITTTHELGDILQLIQSWGRDQSLTVEIDRVDDHATQQLKRLTTLLLDRGYQLKNSHLLLDRQIKKKKNDRKTKPSEILEWETIGSWAKNRQFFNFDGTPQELLYHLGQLDDIRSIAYRLDTNPNRLDFNEVVYIAGINHRMGFISHDHVEDIIRGWPKVAKLNFIDKKILSQLDYPKRTDEIIIELGENARTIRQRLRYLERSRIIRKVLPGSLTIEGCHWIRFEDGLPEYSKTISGKRALASVGTFLLLALESNPPLTKNQLSKYLGITISELESLLNAYLRKNKIIEGYFLSEVGDIQYTTADVLDTMQPSDDDHDLAAVNRVDILPLSDPYALFHLPPLVMEETILQPTERLPATAEQWMITWDGMPVGYFIKQPCNTMLLDYELDMKISSGVVTTPIIAGALQKIVGIFRTWYGDEGKIKTINNISASSPHWKDIHFMIESIGITMD